ncbi:homoserine O-acetyltransferase [Bacillus oleivorans]|uniref:Homoserine O-acetyltransferase n=1 Tax=Bacillus oleivorans TaxID=1448271 RepID=A0A285CZ18_9BACI|nr:homoserine O-acetyltransferase [Bacillus oleivorans]SNX72802.1 homoserine O-acetyltransferase [Bacillus oleivorans]
MKSRLDYQYETNTVQIGDFILESGECLSSVEVAYERAGNFRGPAILVCHALTGNHYAVGTKENPGWWSGLIGPGGYIDTKEYQVITFNVLGGCNGTTGPTSTNPKTGRPYQGSFPYLTIRDLVRVQKKALDQLKIQSLHAVAGGSLGGMQVLEWGLLYPTFLNHLVVLAATPELSDYGMAFNRIAIEAIENDPNWNDGYYRQDAELKGLQIARMAGMITYRTPQLFSKRFEREVRDEGSPTLYQIDSYLIYQGKKLRDRFDANSYLRLLHAMNSHDIGRDRGGWQKASRQIQAKVLALGFKGDLLYETLRIAEFTEAVPDGSFFEVDTIFGHDGFLVEFEKWGPLIKRTLEEKRVTEEVG